MRSKRNMASRKTRTVVYKEDLSPSLAILRLNPEVGSGHCQLEPTSGRVCE